jgi:hypothetical protein
MEARSIPASQWPQFLDEFSRMHHGKPVTVQTMGQAVGVQASVQGVPLLGITAAGGGGGGGDGGREAIDIMTGDSSGTHVRHAVERPVGVWVTEWNDSYSAALKIEAADGLVTVLQVGPSEVLLPPGFITDGIMPDEHRC